MAFEALDAFLDLVCEELCARRVRWDCGNREYAVNRSNVQVCSQQFGIVRGAWFSSRRGRCLLRVTLLGSSVRASGSVETGSGVRFFPNSHDWQYDLCDARAHKLLVDDLLAMIRGL